MRRLDRYLIRETLAPFLLSLAVFTFVLQVNPVLDSAQDLLAKGIPVQTVGYLLLTLIPQALGLTIPIAFLTGVLIALGRLSADRESVALQACGVSPARLLRPVLVMAVLAAGADFYVLTRLIPDANQSYRDVTFRFLAERSASDIKPQFFYEGFPGKVLFVQDVAPSGDWSRVFLADTSDLSRPPTVYLAGSGRLFVDRAQQQVDLLLVDAYQYASGQSGDTYDTLRPEAGSQTRLSIPATSVFGTGALTSLTKGVTEKGPAELQAEIIQKPLRGEPPHNEVMVWIQMFSFPVACLVFAPLGLVLGLNTRAEGKLAGLTQGLAVVFLYYAVMIQAEAWTKGYYSNEAGVGVARWLSGHQWPAYAARWWPNLALGLVGAAAFWHRARPGVLTQARIAAGLQRALAPFRPAAGRSTGPAAGSAVRVVIRIPHFALPRPRLLDLYVGRRYVTLVGLTFVALLGLVYLSTFLDKLDKLFKGQATSGLIVEFLVYATPQFIAFILPMAVLLGVLGTIGGLSRTGELTIMRACGVSLYRAAMPLLVLAVVWSGLLFLLNDRVVAQSNQRAQALDDIIRNRTPHTQNVAENRHWLATERGAFYYYQLYDPTTRRLQGLSVFEPTSRGEYRLLAHTHAATAGYRDGAWVAGRGWVQQFPRPDRSLRETFDARPLPLDDPAEFANAQVDAEVMTYGQLREYINRRSGSGFSLADQRMDLQRKIAFPVVPIVMTLLAVPFGVTTGRRGSLYGIGLAIVLAFAYFLLTAFFSAAGRAAVLPPWLAAWATNILFAMAALYLTLRVRT